MLCAELAASPRGAISAKENTGSGRRRVPKTQNGGRW